MSSLLGLDFGEKRVGIAVSDEMQILAEPLTVIEFRGRKQLLGELQKLVEAYKVHEIIVGLPKTLKGEIGPAAQKIMGHVEWFQPHFPQKWILWDERLSTQEVEKFLIAADVRRDRRKEVRDQLAAQRILQNYLDYLRTKKG